MATEAGVVINEIMYHPPDDRDDLQWVELHNPGPDAVNLRGWELARAIRFVFTNDFSLPAGGFVVVARDLGAFVEHYGVEAKVMGDFAGRLSHSGETVDLKTPGGRVVDSVRYEDKAPWPLSPDGMSSSLERVAVLGGSDDPWNWAPSELPVRESAAGSPGRPNSAAQQGVPPTVSRVTFEVPEVGSEMPVTAEIADVQGIGEVRLAYWVLSMGDAFRGSVPGEDGWREAPMKRVSGEPTRGVFQASIPGQQEGSLVRFRLTAVGLRGATRVHPHPQDARPSWTVYVGPNRNSGQIPWLSLMEFGPPEQPGQSLRTGSSRRGGRAVSGEPARGQAAAVWMPPKGRSVEVRDFVRVTPRHGGWKLRLQKDQMLEEMSTVNLLFESQPRFVLAEHLSYELFREAGVPTPLSGHWRIWHNGRPRGYHLYVEQPNSTFLRRVGRDPDGDLFKLLWYGNGLVGQHEKKNNPESGHAGLVATIEELRQRRGRADWDWIQSRFEVEEFARYYAVNMCLQNWDGFFNNYFIYRAPGKEGKWEILPWDEDKTWGDYDGSSPQYDWYAMPLTMGMDGDHPSRSVFSLFGGGPFGGSAWWRPPGWFSGPLLAHPDFRTLFRKRLRELCEGVFTPENMEVAIARIEVRLGPEVAYRAWIQGAGRATAQEQAFPPRGEPVEIPLESVAGELSRFQRHIGSFRNQAVKRREFILKELAKER